MTDRSQAARWNGTSGEGWVAAAAVLDRLYRPLADTLVDPIPDGGARRIVDIGCGTGVTTVAAAQRLGPAGRSVGIDISEPMITAARARAEREGSPAEFIRADAGSYPFEPGEFDVVLSRFGVMFFDDEPAAFTNLRRASADGATLRFIVWRSAAENPFMTAMHLAARPLLPDLQERPTTGPGPFRFADPDEIRALLRGSGWTGVDVRPLDVDCVMPEADLVTYLTRIGPLALALADADDALRARVVDAVLPAYEQWVHDSEVRLPAACWLVTAE